MLPSIYASSKRCDFKLKALCHNRRQQETSDWPRGQRVYSFFLFFFPGTHSPHRTEMHHLHFWRICFITGLTGVCKHTVSICGASVGGRPVDHSSAGAALWSRRAGACREAAGKGISKPALGVPKVQMPPENRTQTIFNLDCIFTSSSNSNQRLI